jgi:hypothetical protein
MKVERTTDPRPRTSLHPLSPPSEALHHIPRPGHRQARPNPDRMAPDSLDNPLIEGKVALPVASTSDIQTPVRSLVLCRLSGNWFYTLNSPTLVSRRRMSSFRTSAKRCFRLVSRWGGRQRASRSASSRARPPPAPARQALHRAAASARFSHRRKENSPARRCQSRLSSPFRLPPGGRLLIGPFSLLLLPEAHIAPVRYRTSLRNGKGSLSPVARHEGKHPYKSLAELPPCEEVSSVV